MMTTLASKEVIERRPLQPVAAGGWLAGFRNLLRKELGQWWGTKMWWAQLLIWVLLLNGITTIVTLTEAMTPDALLQEVLFTFLPLSIGAIVIGTIITVQGAIVGEKELGTAAWVMSKPASRPAFILTKILAYTSGFWVIAIAIPAIIFVIVTRLLVPEPFALLPFLAGVAVVALAQLFYLTLTLMLGTLFSNRGPVIGIGMAFILTGLLLKGFIPQPVMMVTPWSLPDVSAAVASHLPLPDNWFVPVVATGLWIVLFTAVALWRFSREEF
jgi:ABC-2 type transport system permease protein